MYNSNLPFFYHSPFSSRNFASRNIPRNIQKPQSPSPQKFQGSSQSTLKAKSQTQTNNQNNTINNSEVLFEIFGLKIHFDDILIICILLFLYQEGIQDEYLFIALILLLLS